MPNRLRLFDFRNSRLPGLIGACSSDIVTIRNNVNSAQERLIMAKEAGDEGWNGSWAEIAFTLNRNTPYFTAPREVARLEVMTICNRPIVIHNQFFEYLRFGNGRMPQCPTWSRCLRLTESYGRNNAITFNDMASTSQYLRAYATDPADLSGLRIFFQGLDNNNNVIYSQDGLFEVQGVWLNFTAPFVQTPMLFNKITGIQKDVTSGPVRIFEVDPQTGNQNLIHTMEAGEQVASYRRYFFDKLPFACCPDPSPIPQAIPITALAKMEPIPVVADTDYLILTSKEAIISECESMRYEGIDTPTSKAMAQFHHKQAIGYLNAELTHVNGLNLPDVQYKPYGSARLERQKIGLLR